MSDTRIERLRRRLDRIKKERRRDEVVQEVADLRERIEMVEMVLDALGVTDVSSLRDRALNGPVEKAMRRNTEVHEYADHTPSFVGERKRTVSELDDDEILTELGIRERPVSDRDPEDLHAGHGIHEGEFVAASGGIETYRDRNGDYRLTTEAIRCGLSDGIQIAHPTRLRELADEIEVRDQ